MSDWGQQCTFEGAQKAFDSIAMSQGCTQPVAGRIKAFLSLTLHHNVGPPVSTRLTLLMLTGLLKCPGPMKGVGCPTFKGHTLDHLIDQFRTSGEANPMQASIVTPRF